MHVKKRSESQNQCLNNRSWNRQFFVNFALGCLFLTEKKRLICFSFGLKGSSNPWSLRRAIGGLYSVAVPRPTHAADRKIYVLHSRADIPRDNKLTAPNRPQNGKPRVSSSDFPLVQVHHNNTPVTGVGRSSFVCFFTRKSHMMLRILVQHTYLSHNAIVPGLRTCAPTYLRDIIWLMFYSCW